MSTLIRTKDDLGKLKTDEAVLFLDNAGQVIKITFRLYEKTLYVDAAEVFRVGISPVLVQYLQHQVEKTFKGYTVVAA